MVVQMRFQVSPGQVWTPVPERFTCLLPLVNIFLLIITLDFNLIPLRHWLHLLDTSGKHEKSFKAI
jgi:hypothetical protein